MIAFVETINGELVVRIPQKLLDAAGLSAGSRVRIMPARYTLEELCSQVTEENRHDGVDWGPPVGNEIW